jgi:hypothetical protein
VLRRSGPTDVSALTTRPPSRLGRRGSTLLLYGIGWLVLAWSIVVRPATADTDLFAFIPTGLHVGLWVTAGVVAIMCAFHRRPGADSLGFTVSAVLAVIRAFTYGWAWVQSLVYAGGDRTAWLGCLLWAVIAVKVTTDAGWPESPTMVGPRRKGRR